MLAHRVQLTLCLITLFGLSGCVVAGHTSSPWEWGGGVRVAPGFDVGEQAVTVHPTAGYTYLSFDGGHDGLWEFGVQARKPSSIFSDQWPGFWLGGEATFSHLRTVSDFQGESTTYTTNGFAFTALAGAPVNDGRWGVNWFVGAGLSRYGSTGFNIRAGIDLQPWFLER
jgi:hypothetical protein